MIKKILLEEWENLSELIRVINKNGGVIRTFSNGEFQFSRYFTRVGNIFSSPVLNLRGM